MTIKTFTPSYTDELAQACGGELNAASLAARVAAMIKGNDDTSITRTVSYMCSLYGWSGYKLKKYASILQNNGILSVIYGTHKGTQTIWAKGKNFDTFFNTKEQNFSPFKDDQRGKFFCAKGQNFSPLQYTNNKQLYYNNKNKNLKNNFAIGDELGLNEFWSVFHTSSVQEVADSCGEIWKENFTNERGVWMTKIK